VFLAWGAFTLWVGAEYPLGRAGRIGPGYMPRLLGLTLAGIGILLALRSWWTRDAVDTHIAWRPATLVLGSVVIFALVFESFGLVPAILASVAVANFAVPDNGWTSAIALGAALSAFSWALFVKALGLPIPVFLP
jgi:hypothetical protein